MFIPKCKKCGGKVISAYTNKRTGKQHADCCVNRTIFLQGKTEHTYMDCFGADCYQPDSHKLAPEKRYPNSAKAAPL